MEYITMIPGLGFLNTIPVHMDYVGQRKAERIFQVILVISGIVGFIVGFLTQQLSHSVYIVGAGFALSGLITLPPWPYFRQNPLQWQKAVEPKAGGDSQSSKSKKKKQ